MFYRRLCRGLNDRGTLIPSNNNPFDYIDNVDTDWYLSIYEYNPDQYEQFQKTNTISGITDVVTSRLTWDLDYKEDVEVARQDAITLCNKLLDMDINSKDIIIAYSGSKGFHISLELKSQISVQQFKKATVALAEDLKSFDKTVSNPSRILRVNYTKHPSSGLYKIPLLYFQLKSLDIANIKSLAVHPDNNKADFNWKKIDFPPEYLEIENEEKPSDVITANINFSNKPKFLTNCRYALQNGYFDEGQRSYALLCLASTYKNLGFDIEHVYRMLKGVAELQAKRNNVERFSDKEIYNTIISQVFGPFWHNGQYTCKDKDNWLHDYCNTLGLHKCNQSKDDSPKHFVDITGSFKDYVKNIEKNTITTGLPSIDENVFISTGANVAILGAAASGKSSVALNILNNTSRSGVKSVFASLDMHHNRMFEKVMYKVTGMKREELYDVFKKDKEGPYLDKLKEEFGNVYFFNRSCPTVSDVREYILSCQDKSGEKIKLVMLDYFERVTSDIGDDTAASKRVAGELQDLVNDLDIALVTLVQPNKFALSGGPDSPIWDYTKIKGSSYVYQSMRIILSIWRPFYNPQTFENDKYMQMAVLKNDLGELNNFAFNWNGARGEISELEQHQWDEFEQMLKAKENAKAGENKEPW